MPSKSLDSPVGGELLVSRTSELSPNQRPLCHDRLLLAEGSHTLGTFIDSGSDVSLINKDLAQQLGLVPTSAFDGHLQGTVTHQTVPVHMLLSGNYHEIIPFHILQSPQLPLILGYPWLRRHNPNIDWATGSILGWSSSCHTVCLKQATAPQPSPSPSSTPDLSGVLVDYDDFREVFSKAKVTSLPLHLPYHCTINLQHTAFRVAISSLYIPKPGQVFLVIFSFFSYSVFLKGYVCRS